MLLLNRFVYEPPSRPIDPINQLYLARLLTDALILKCPSNAKTNFI